MLAIKKTGGETMKQLRPLLAQAFALATLLLATNSQAEQPISGYLGMGVDVVPASVKAHFPDEMADAQGLVVTQFADKSPAADDGIKLYDVLVAYDDQPITDPEAFILKVRNDKSGRIVNFRLLRQGKILTLPITMGEQKTIKETPPMTAVPASQGQARPPVYGLQRMPPRYPARGFPPYRQYPMPQRPMAYQAPNANYPRARAPAYARPYTAPNTSYTPYPRRQAPLTRPPLQSNLAFKNNGKPVFPMQKKSIKKKHAWGDKRNIWDDFYTDFTGDLWDKMVNAPFDAGRMPGGWRAPSLSTPDPVTIGDAVTNQLPPMVEEMGNMTDFSN